MTGTKILIFFCSMLVAGMIMCAGCTQKADHTPAIPSGIVSVTSGPAPDRASPSIFTPPMTDTATESTDFSEHFLATELLSRPTDHSVTVSVVSRENSGIFFAYGIVPKTYSCETPVVQASAGSPFNSTIAGLAPDMRYYYRACIETSGTGNPACGPEHSFHTARSVGSSFVFDVQADSHLDEKASGALYNRTLANELIDTPDFLIDLGDTSMAEKLPVKSTDAIRSQYIRQRLYFSTIGHSVPLFLVLGNHDGEAGYAPGGKDNSLALLSLQFRKMYFPNPEPDGFYTGNAVIDADTGLRQDYYAWQWGDAIFIVLDPYWYTTSKPGGGNTSGWGWTLGRTQYDWLKDTLATKKATYTFVFAHQLVGGDPQGRGGIEFASLYEWGGNNPDGSYGFDQHRPGWGVPIHQLLVENNVTAFFHGHDHLFAYQELDGVVYQDVPQPATTGTPHPGAEYGYVNGTMLPSPGYLRISVAPDSARVEYIGSALHNNTRNSGSNGAIVSSYTLSPGQNPAGG